jgi:hypothetical protein
MVESNKINKGILRPKPFSNADTSASRQAYERKNLGGKDLVLEGDEEEDEEKKERERINELLNRRPTSLSLSQLFELARLAPW